MTAFIDTTIKGTEGFRFLSSETTDTRTRYIRMGKKVTKAKGTGRAGLLKSLDTVRGHYSALFRVASIPHHNDASRLPRSLQRFPLRGCGEFVLESFLSALNTEFCRVKFRECVSLCCLSQPAQSFSSEGLRSKFPQRAKVRIAQ